MEDSGIQKIDRNKNLRNKHWQHKKLNVPTSALMWGPAAQVT